MDTTGQRLRRLQTSELTARERTALRALLDDAFHDDDPEERFDDDDWEHALGGTHVIVDQDGAIVAHASVVERVVRVGDRALHTGYVEAVAVEPGRQGDGLGTVVMEAIDELIRAGFELGALGTGASHFYERLGWRTWAGPTAVRAPDGDRRTPDDDGFVMVLRTPTTPPFEETGPIVCDWRPGDVW